MPCTTAKDLEDSAALMIKHVIEKFTFSGHHETPPEAHTKILERFPDSFPRNQGNVIPPTTDKKVEEVSVSVWSMRYLVRRFYRYIQASAQDLSLTLPRPPLNMSQKVNDSGMDDSPPSPLPETSIQEPGSNGRTVRPEAPVDSMLKDMATIIFSTFLLAGWVAFVITYPKVSVT